MVEKAPKRPRDPNQLARFIVDAAASGGEPGRKVTMPAVDFARKGGLKGGRARADKLSPEARALIAKKAAKARWEKK